MYKNVYSTHQIAEICHVHYTTVIIWIEDGKLNAYTTPGGHRRIKKPVLVEFLKKYNLPLPEELLTSHMRILIVDDDADYLEEIKVALSGYGFDLDFALSGFEAGSKVYSKKPDLILLDFKMPGMDGFKVCNALKKDSLTCKIPVFAVTALDIYKDIENLKQCGVDAYIPKPVDVDNLLGLIKKTLGII
ncbi:MAG: response regulator [Candidatus Omnitrophica bacterium]|nr:response regulator [Candidatus Omnitrophota bacterium]MCK5288928.1 response regulator [Candidatus Omnitrophota bacterium]MCK5393109.1 response regulator [Candidatus Omnitrophota bacterium]